MKSVLACFHRIVRLFVDDTLFAGAIAIWLLGSVWLFPPLTAGPGQNGVLLFAGLACILLGGACGAQRARRTRDR